MDILVKRDIFNENETLGEVFVNGKWVCFSLEDAYREDDSKSVEDWKIKGKTAIPKGTYNVIIDYSNKFAKYLCLIENVPCYSGVRIHAGNTHMDTDGCILLGMQRTKNAVQHSKDAVATFQPMVAAALGRGEECLITIE